MHDKCYEVYISIPLSLLRSIRVVNYFDMGVHVSIPWSVLWNINVDIDWSMQWVSSKTK